MSYMYGKKILNKNITLYYADAENGLTLQYRSNVKIIPLTEYPTITTGTPETRSVVFFVDLENGFLMELIIFTIM